MVIILSPCILPVLPIVLSGSVTGGKQRPWGWGVCCAGVILDGSFVKEVNVDADKLYALIDLPTAGEHLLELEFPDGTLELYTFTFG